MKKLLSFLLAFLCCASLHAQVDEHGNPVFNSMFLNNEFYDGYGVGNNYYTIKNNINDRKSSVYMDDNPTLEQYIAFATSYPSHFLVISREIDAIGGIVAGKSFTKGYGENVFILYHGKPQKQDIIPCLIPGDIAEHRAYELNGLKIDTNSKIIETDTGKVFFFNGAYYKIQSYDLLKEALKELAAKISSEYPDPQPEANPVEYVKRESINGGKLDIHYNLTKSGQTKFGYMYKDLTRDQYAILVWAKRVRSAGIKSPMEAVKLWEEIYKQKLTDENEDLLKLSFENLPLKRD